MNLRPPACKADALPIELHPQEKMVGAAGFEPATSCSQSRSATRLRYAPNEIGGGERDRTDGLLHAMQALSQLSYTPKRLTMKSAKRTLSIDTRRNALADLSSAFQRNPGLHPMPFSRLSCPKGCVPDRGITALRHLSVVTARGARLDPLFLPTKAGSGGSPLGLMAHFWRKVRGSNPGAVSLQPPLSKRFPLTTRATFQNNKLALVTGFEPVSFCVKGRCPGPLDETSKKHGCGRGI